MDSFKILILNIDNPRNNHQLSKNVALSYISSRMKRQTQIKQKELTNKTSDPQKFV